MTCPRCQQENPAEAHFCLKCGTGLTLACARCNTELPTGAAFCFACGQPVTAAPDRQRFTSPDAYTPKHLAEKILTSKSALEGERKQVTVLFADLKGSMELLADRDPEEARKLLDPVLEQMMEAVHRYEGTVNQVMGDGIMALFGAPLAHEDHAVRACYAALRMQESVKRYTEEVRRSHGIEVQIRVGLNSGEVVVRAIGSDLHMDYTAVGQTTHLAARMEQLATPGSIRLTANTLRLAEGYVEIKALGPVPVKGLSAPVEVYEATGAGAVRSRLQAAAARGLTRFVGRDTEIDQLRRALEQSRAGHGQLVATVGDPGVGKSRLFHEFTHSHRTQDWLMLESGSVSYGKATSYLPVIDLLKVYFKVHDRETHRELREKVTGKLLTLDRTLEPTLPALLALLDVPVDDTRWQALDPPQRRRQTLDAVKGLLLRESQLQPLLVIFEDLHWIDSETQALLDSLVESLPTARFLLLVNYRPEYRHAWGSKTYYTQLRLDTLPPESANELLLALLGTDATVEPLKPVLIARTGGNPLFLEESVRTLVETHALTGERGAYRLVRPLATIDVPATVQAILASRIDRLAPEDKQLLQTASVIGKDVPFALLQAIAELPEDALRRGLAHLQSAEFLYETSLFPDLEYTFKHALTHEVAYGSLLQERRRALHRAVVTGSERLHADRLAEHYERLAHHAGLGELWEKAVRYGREAGLKAIAHSANQDAARFLQQALDALARLPETPETLAQSIDARLALRTALQALRDLDGQRLHLAEAIRQAEAIGDQRRLGRALMFETLRTALSGDYTGAGSVGRRALEIGDSLGDVTISVLTRCYLGISCDAAGDFPAASELLERALTLLPENLMAECLGQAGITSALALGTLGRVYAEQGRFADALAKANEALRIAETASHGYSIATHTWSRGLVKLRLGDFVGAVVDLERSRSVWQSLHITVWPDTVATLGVAYCRVGRFAEGLELMEEAESQRGILMSNPPIAALAEAYFLARRLEEAGVQAQRALVYARERTQRGVEARVLALVAALAAAGGPAANDTAERLYMQATALAERLGMRPLVAHCHLGLSKLYRSTDKRELAQEHLTTATTMYREMDMRFWLEQAEAAIKECR